MPVLIKFSRDWADEFQAEGFRVVDSPEEADEVKRVWSKARTFFFGTNEGWEAEHQTGKGYIHGPTYGVLANAMTFEPITDEEAESLRRLFGLTNGISSFGIIPTYWDDDEDEEEE